MQLEADLKTTNAKAAEFERLYSGEVVTNKALFDMVWKEKALTKSLRGQVTELEAVKRDLDIKLGK